MRLTPRAAHSRIDAARLDEAGRWQLEARVRAVPEKGLANAALVALVAEALGVAKSAVLLETGGRSRSKRLRVEGDEVQLAERLRALADQ